MTLSTIITLICLVFFGGGGGRHVFLFVCLGVCVHITHNAAAISFHLVFQNEHYSVLFIIIKLHSNTESCVQMIFIVLCIYILKLQ